MFPDKFERFSKCKSMREQYQESINKNKYMTIATSLKELDEKLAIFDKNNFRLNDKMITSQSVYEIKGYQKNGYIYEDNGLWLMPFSRIEKIEKIGH